MCRALPTGGKDGESHAARAAPIGKFTVPGLAMLKLKTKPVHTVAEEKARKDICHHLLRAGTIQNVHFAVTIALET